MQTMTTAPDDLLPLACVPGAIPAAERAGHFALLARLFRNVSPVAVPHGYAFTFPPDAFDDVARFVGNERRCCPFLAFDIELAPSGGPLTLRLTGPAGTRAFLDAEIAG